LFDIAKIWLQNTACS